VKPEDIKASYDALAEHWASESFNARNGIEQHRRAIAFCQAKGKALDIGCGSNVRFAKLLQEAGFAVHGVDLSPRMIELARKSNPEASYEQADIDTWEPPERYAFVSAWDSIWHLDTDAQERVLQKVSHGLDEGGILIFSAGALDAQDAHTDTYLQQPLSYATLGTPRLLSLLAASKLILRHLEQDQFPEKHLVLIAQKAASPTRKTPRGRPASRMKIREIASTDPDLPMDLIRSADPSEAAVASYLADSRLFVGTAKGATLAFAALRLRDKKAELMNLAVTPTRRREGLGAQMVAHLKQALGDIGIHHLTVGTGNSSLGPLAFYQRQGFCIESLRKGHFLDATPPITENGIRCRDMIVLSCDTRKLSSID